MTSLNFRQINESKSLLSGELVLKMLTALLITAAVALVLLHIETHLLTPESQNLLNNVDSLPASIF